ncbi:MAG TPA: hypothetical protein VFR47_24055 [Anaerolineales bacterium]|nr:hypothetical protein [Anaerolineales bacterium]
MNTNSSLRQFVKDGLIGLAIVFLVFVVLLGILLRFLKPSTYEFWWLIRELFVFPKAFQSLANGIPDQHVFNSPMPLIIVITFLTLGSSGSLFENITSRVSWMKPIMIVVVKSWSMGVILWPILLFLIVRLWVGSSDSLHFSAISPQLTGIIGAIVGLLIGFLAGFILNPRRRQLRIAIGAIASVCVAYGAGAGILLQQEWLW